MLFVRAFAISLLLAAPANTPQSLLGDLGKAYATDAKVAFGGVTLGASSSVSAATLVADRKRILDALRVGYAPDGKATFEAIPWSEIHDILSVKTKSGSNPEDAASAAIVVGVRVVPTTWTFAGTVVQGFAVFDGQGRLTFETLLFLPAIRIPLFEASHL